MGYESYLALQYIKPKRKRGFINLITVISVAGVAVSVGFLIVVISVMNGFDRDIRDKIIGTNAHVLVNTYSKDGIGKVPELLRDIRALPGVQAASPFYLNHGMLKSSSADKGVVIHGVMPESHIEVTAMQNMILQGDFNTLNDPPKGTALPPVFLGAELMEHLDLRMGDKVTLLSPVLRMTPAGMMPSMARLEVAGVFKTGFYEYDSGLVYMGLNAAQKLFDAENVVTQIGVRVERLEKAHEIADEIQAMDNGINFWARDWLRMHDNLFKALHIEKLVMFLILTCTVIVAAFNIVSTLVMIVMEKQKEIGVLMAMGASPGGILRIFLYQGLVVGGFGTAIGLVLGLLLCWLVKAYEIPIPGGGEVYYLEYLPVSVQPLDVVLIVMGSLVSSFLATLYPAWNAGHLDPVEAIRYE